MTQPADPDALDPTLDLPGWAAEDATWEQLVTQLRVWLKPDDSLLSDAELQQMLLSAPSFLFAVRLAWLTKIRYYSDPNRLIRGQIGNEVLQFPDPKDLIAWARSILGDIDDMLGYGRSRVLSMQRPQAEVWGVTPYRLSPPPYVYYAPGERPEAWDLTRFPPQVWIDRAPWPNS